MKLKTVCISVILFSLSIKAQNYQLVWYDSFLGNELDTDSWSYETGGGGWGNNELQYYTSRPDNLYLENGRLVITAKRETYGGSNYTSARIVTKGKKFFRYGKVEARIRMPFGQGIWPAFWMLGENFSSVGWPRCGEIDIVEMIGGTGNENKAYGTAHWDNNGSHAQYGGYTKLQSGILADDWHLYAVEWNNQSIKWFFDGNKYHEIDITSSELREFHNEYFIILNLAVGGKWPGYPDGTTLFPQTLEVDYIRVYQDLPTGIETDTVPPEERLLVYPNPFNSQINVILNSKGIADRSAELKLFNLLGQEMFNAEYDIQSGINNFSLNLHGIINSGIYLLVVDTGANLYTHKIMYLK
ncbi:MAG: family 16 glycosylhydrolase [Melioribacteraceae bacterium]|nr:family 16 glycosylhydrolase [Melioribacteraceae bacterium]